MKKWISRILPMLALAFAMCILQTQVYANSPDGSISVEIRAYATDRAVSGGTLNLYRIAEADGMEFIYLESFSGCDESLLIQEELEKADTAELFEAYAEKNGIEADDAATVSSSGRATFSNLSEGLYMVTRSEPAEGYTSVNAFLVTIPMEEDGTYIYDVDASPKAVPVEKAGSSAAEKNRNIENTKNAENTSENITQDTVIGDSTTPTDSSTVAGQNPRTGDEPIGFIAAMMCFALASGIFVYIRKENKDSDGGNMA